MQAVQLRAVSALPVKTTCALASSGTGHCLLQTLISCCSVRLVRCLMLYEQLFLMSASHYASPSSSPPFKKF